MLPHSDRLLDEEVKILWDLRCQAISLQNSQDLVSGDGFHLPKFTIITSFGHCQKRILQIAHNTLGKAT